MKHAIRWLLFAFLLAPRFVLAEVFLTLPDALAKLFPKPDKVEERRAFLSKQQIEKAKIIAGSGVDIESGLVTYYQAYDQEGLLGTAYLDTHRIRTLDETLLITINRDNTIRQIDILRFGEPPEYVAPAPWLEQFKGRRLDDTLSLKGSVHGITGASLTARSITVAARRMLALHQVLKETTPK